MTGTDLMPSGAVQTFTGSNGASPSATDITTALNQGSGGSVTIQSNTLQLKTGTTAFNRTSVRITGVSISDGEIEFTWTVPSASVIFMGCFVRANSAIDGGQGYLVSLQAADMTVTRHNPTNTYTGPDLQTITHGFTTGQVVRSRIALFGLRIRARTWLVGNSEPTSLWPIDYTDTVGAGGFTTAGSWGLTASSATSGSQNAFFDDLDLHDTITPTQATLFATGSITPTGALTKKAPKTFAGSITPSGALAKSRSVTRAFAGAITPAGAFIKVPLKVLSGTITPTGAFAKRPAKLLTGSIVPTGILHKRPAKKMSGTITPTGGAVITFIGRIFGRPGVAVMNLLQRATVTIRYRRD